MVEKGRYRRVRSVQKGARRVRIKSVKNARAEGRGDGIEVRKCAGAVGRLAWLKTVGNSTGERPASAGTAGRAHSNAAERAAAAMFALHRLANL